MPPVKPKITFLNAPTRDTVATGEPTCTQTNKTDVSQFERVLPISIDQLAQLTCPNDDACDRAAARNHIELHVNEDDRAGKRDSAINYLEATHYIKSLKFGHTIPPEGKELYERTYTAIIQAFYGGSPLDSVRSTIKPFEIWFDKFEDGDTGLVKVCVGGTLVEIFVRFSGIDTPESIPVFDDWVTGEKMDNPKIVKFNNFIWKYWKSQSQLPDSYDKHKDSIQAMAKDRMLYTGLMSGVAAKGLQKWVQEEKGLPFTVDNAFNRASTDMALCDKIEGIGNYGRLIGQLKAGKIDENKNLLADFIENALPEIMSKGEGPGWHNYFSSGTASDLLKNDKDWDEVWKNYEIGATTKDGRTVLEELQKDSTDNEEIAQILSAIDPQSLMKPSEMFSRERCKEMAGEWIKFSAKFPEYKNDVQAMLIFLGLGYAYPKYRNNNIPAYMAAEKISIEKKFGLSGDPVFEMTRPNPEHSDMFRVYAEELGRGKKLVPPDCLDDLHLRPRDMPDPN